MNRNSLVKFNYVTLKNYQLGAWKICNTNAQFLKNVQKHTNKMKLILKVKISGICMYSLYCLMKLLNIYLEYTVLQKRKVQIDE